MDTRRNKKFNQVARYFYTLVAFLKNSIMLLHPFMKLKSLSLLIILFLFANVSCVFSQESAPPAPAPSTIEPPYNHFFKTTYLNLSAVYDDLVTATIEELLPPPIEGTDEAEDDQNLRQHIYESATKKQIFLAKDSVDSIFSYAYTLGDKFSAQSLPKTKAFFDKVDDDVRLAIYIAKRFYGRRRPMSSSGYSYPSGHSTRAFFWNLLLSEIFPSDKEALEDQAKLKAWNRVILGRHYPADVYAGKAFGTYLAQKLLDNPAFRKEWSEVEEEIKSSVGVNPSVATIHSRSNSVP